ncbi:MAG: GGDEF domain-containing protein [Anaerolineae bacterium]|nr:GGDEF domain-containing protein [Anaerolineae bacterium]
MTVDFTTLAITLSLSNVLQVAALFAQTKMVRKYPGGGWWTLGITCTALGFFAMFMRAIPQFTLTGIFANNILFVMGHILLYVGILRFFGHHEKRKILISFGIFFALYDFYFVYIYDHLIWRGSMLYLSIAALSFITAAALLKYKPRAISATVYFLTTAFILHGLVFVAGFIMGLVIPPNSNSSMAANPAQVLGLLDGLVSTTLWTFGFILMVNQRLGKELEDQAGTDILTRIKNRRYFLFMAEAEAKRAVRYKYSLTLALIDLDNFKNINDTYGHPVGDEALIMFADRCRGSIRETDLLARFGGDEFALLLPQTSLDQARAVLERIRSAIITQPFQLDGKSIPVTLSAGIACAQAGSVFSFDDLVARTDKVLYYAKESGRNRINIENELQTLNQKPESK